MLFAGLLMWLIVSIGVGLLTLTSKRPGLDPDSAAMGWPCRCPTALSTCR